MKISRVFKLIIVSILLLCISTQGYVAGSNVSVFDDLKNQAVNANNLALNKTIMVDVYDINGNLAKGYAAEPQNALDGDKNTAFETYSAVRYGNVIVDLGEAQKFDSVNIYPLAASQTVFIESYSLYYSSNGSDWTPIVEDAKTNGTPIKLSFDSVIGQYVKLNVLESIPNGLAARGLYYGFKISEFEIYNSKEAIENQKKIADELNNRLKDAVVLFAGYPEAISKNILTFVDNFNNKVVPVIENDTTFVPVRFISEQFGGNVDWDNNENTVTIDVNEHHIKIDTVNQKLYIDNSDKCIDTSIKLIDGRTFIPLRQIGESLGLEVFWDNSGLIILSNQKEIIKNDEHYLVDNLLKIINPSNEVLAEELPILDDFSVDSSMRYKKLEKMQNFRVLEGQFIPSKLARGDFYRWERMDRVLNPGQTVSIQLKMTNINYQSAGIIIDNKPIKVNRSYTYFTLTDGIDAEYLLEGEQIDNLCTLIVTRGEGENANKINWYVDGSIKGEGSYIHPDLPYNATIGLYVRHGWQEACDTVILDNFRLGTAKRPFRTSTPSRYSPAYYPQSPAAERTAMWEAADSKLFISDLNGPLSKEDIESFKQVVSAAPIPYNNVNDCLLFQNEFNLYDAVIVMYQITKDKFFLDKLIEYTDSVVSCRNDLQEDGIIVQTGVKEPIWPNYNRTYVKGEPVWVTDFPGPTDLISNVAKLIVDDQSLWDEIVPVEDKFGYGKTYLERAMKYLDSADTCIFNFRVKYYLDEATNRMLYPTGEEWHAVFDSTWGGKEGPWNREWMNLAGMNNIIQCYDKLSINKERSELYQAIIQTNLDYFFDCLEIVNKDGKDVAQWWYKGNGGVREDISHGAYDMYFLMKFYESGRYGITEAMMRPFANMLLRFDAKNAQFYYYVDETGGMNTTIHGMYLAYSKIDKEVYHHLKDYMYRTKDIRKIAYLLYGKYIVYGMEN